MSNGDVAVEDLRSLETFAKYLGKENFYHSFLLFFQAELEAKGWENVLNEYLFAGDEKSDDLLKRLYGGLYSVPYYNHSKFTNSQVSFTLLFISASASNFTNRQL
jgi:hypothetical protein